MADTHAWLDVFPELAGETSDRALQDLLRRVDAVPSELAPQWAAVAAPEPPSGSSATGPEPGARVFGAFLHGLVAAPLAAFGQAAHRMPLLSDPDQVTHRAHQAVLDLAADQATRTLLVLLHEAADAGRLEAGTPEERYQEFAAGIAAPAGRQDVYERYPDLVARVRALVDLRLTALLDQLSRTAESWSAICASLGLDPAGRIRDVEPAGDPHGGGRCVLLLATDTGDRLVMKPRPSHLEAGYASFAAWLAEAATLLTLPRPAVHLEGSDGWMEHVSRSVAAPGGDFFAMGGVHLAALHLLRGSDVHYENLLTDEAGRPVVVDAEALFRPVLAGSTPDPGGLLDVEATGLLSLPFGDDASFDFGALEYRSGARSPFRAWHLVNAFRDDMRMQMLPVEVDHPDAVPPGTRRGRTDATRLVEGFEAALSFAASSPGRVLERLGRDFTRGRCRYIHRPTMTYALLLRMATHPRFEAAADRQRVFGRLAVLAPATGWDLVASEIRQLTAGEIPAFGVDLHDQRLLDARGRDTGVRTALTPMQGVVSAVEALDLAHVDRQTARLRAALSHWGHDSTRSTEQARPSRPRKAHPWESTTSPTTPAST